MQKLYLFLFTGFIICNLSVAQNLETIVQEKKAAKLFRTDEILPIKLSYSSKDIKQKTNDSTYIKTDVTYKDADGTWKTMKIEIRARGGFRRENCYFTRPD